MNTERAGMPGDVVDDLPEQSDRWDEYEECRVIRPGTLGYQMCLLPKGHDGQPHRSQDRKEWS